MGSIKRLIEKEVSKVYVKSLEIGGNIGEDTLNGFFLNEGFFQIEFFLIKLFSSHHQNFGQFNTLQAMLT